MSSTAALSPGTREINIDGVRQVFHVAGTGPVCVVHPGGPGIAWEYLRMPGLEEHLTMVYLEPVGTGASGRLDDPREYRLDAYARFVHGVVEHLGLPKVFLLGHSHGGFVAQRYALDHADRLAGLILFATSPVTGPEFWADAVANVNRFPERHPGRREAAEIPQAFQDAVAATDDKSFTDGLRRVLPAYFNDYWAHEQMLEPMRAALRAWIDPQRGEEPAPFDVRDRLGSIALPTLVLTGAHDFICGTRWASMLHEGIPGSRLTVLSESGHMGHLEQPELFTRAVAEFARA
ncbi:alpha/beta hydrolase [Planotetraspora phitsanulokensis]|uniref:Hydrolase n=1 Tax=Planotetraspora phitsanulokensis TaxID=575192 RepID=A0A8J3ULS1_9ACTN|nr:alpha/beta hydrolase [Planotetraspora phitsanulokensis]GII41055.1 hydrolase [Planotetraspora phitsanulokensis]